MTHPLDSVLTHAQRESLEIVDFIFHVIDPEAPGKVIKLDEVHLQDRQKEFFLDRLRDIAEGTQYIFNQDEVNLDEQGDQLLNERESFVEISYALTREFARLHSKNMSAGVFIVSTVKYLAQAHDWKQLVFLVKMDKQESFSYSYKEVEGKKIAVLNEIPNALNENKRAIQKSALIDPSDHFAWDVLAFDRVKKPFLGDYFRTFLGVVERHQDSDLTRRAYQVVRRWAKSIHKEQLPPREDLNTYRGRALNYLNDHDSFDTDAFLDAVVKDNDEDRKAEHTGSLRNSLAEAGVAGQRFSPQPNSLTKPQRRQVYETREGVTIVFEGTLEEAGMHIEKLENGGSVVTITTNHLEPKG